MCSQDDRFYLSEYQYKHETSKEWKRERARMRAVRELAKSVTFSCDRKGKRND